MAAADYEPVEEEGLALVVILLQNLTAEASFLGILNYISHFATF